MNSVLWRSPKVRNAHISRVPVATRSHNTVRAGPRVRPSLRAGLSRHTQEKVRMRARSASRTPRKGNARRDRARRVGDRLKRIRERESESEPFQHMATFLFRRDSGRRRARPRRAARRCNRAAPPAQGSPAACGKKDTSVGFLRAGETGLGLWTIDGVMESHWTRARVV